MVIEKDWEIERLFYKEIGEKKRVGNGIMCKTGKRGYVGKMKTTADLLKANDKKKYKEYIKGGTIKVSNMYSELEKVPKFKEFQSMDNKKAVEFYNTIREYHTVTVLKNYWNISGYKFYQHLADIGIGVKSPKNTREENRARAKANAALKEVALTVVENTVSVPEIPTAPVKKEVVEKRIEGFELIYNKSKIKGGTIQEVVVNLVSILNASSEYEISLNIKEKE